MFFRDPARAFANIARALRPGGRLVTMTWQAREDNEWDATIRDALAEAGAPPVSQGNAAFSLADPPAVTDLLESAGFADVSFTDVREPVYYGLNADAALDWVCGFASTKAMLSALDPPAKADALRRLRNAFTTHLASSGVWFGSRSWVIAARRRCGSSGSEAVVIPRTSGSHTGQFLTSTHPTLPVWPLTRSQRKP
jgi:SAM-dependent methyltransferase